MNKLLLLTSCIMALATVTSFAQKSASKPIAQAIPDKDNSTPVVTIGTIQAATTSREMVLAYPRLLAQELNCDIKGFSFTISAHGNTWGPFEVKGAVFTDEVKDKIKATDAPPRVTITIDNIRVSCNGGPEVMAKPIVVAYDH